MIRETTFSSRVVARLLKVGGFAIIGFAVLSGSSAFAVDTAYQNDSQGRVIKVTYPDSKQICYSYEAAGNRTQVKRQSTGTCTVAGSTLNAAKSTEVLAAAQQSADSLNTAQATQNEAVAATTSTDEPAAGF